MESTIPDEAINQSGKRDAGAVHTEKIVDDELKSSAPQLTRAQAGRYTLKQDFRVLPMLGVIYAVSILDRINVSRLSPRKDKLSSNYSRSAPLLSWAWWKI